MVGHPPQNDDDYGPRSYGGGGAPGPGDDEVRPVSGPWDLLGGIRGAWGGWGGWQGADGPSGGSWGTPWGAPWGGPGRGGPDGPGSGRRGHGHPGGRRANRGDVRAAVIHLLAEEPMHGYQIIREIEQRSDGAWKPSAGSVYPTLQLLADEGLLTVEEDAGRKTYSLTDEGRAEAERLQEGSRRTPWEFSTGPDLGRLGSVPKAGALLGQAVAQVTASGTTDQVERAVAVLDEARRRIHEILAEDSDDPEAG